MKKYFQYLVLLVAFPTAASADGWALFSKQNDLKNHAIVDVGEISEVSKPVGANWNVDLYQMNGRCLAFSGYSSPPFYGRKAALLLANSAQRISLAILETSISSIKVDVYAVEMYECPNSSGVVPYSSDPAEMLRLLEERQRELQRQLDELSR